MTFDPLLRPAVRSLSDDPLTVIDHGGRTVYAIYRDSRDVRPYVLRRFDANRERPLGSEVYRGSDLGEVRSFLAERCETRLENLDREPRHPQSLVELWVKPR